MEKRNRPRLPRRLTCRIDLGESCVTGFVRDVSETGLFVQTGASPATNSLVNVIFPADGDRPEIRVEAGVARKRDVARRLHSSVPSGIGLEVIPPRHEYERWVFAPARPALAGSPSTTHYAFLAHDLEIPPVRPRPVRAYRFRMTRHDRSGSKILTIRCETEAGARARALVRAGAGWRIADAQVL